MKYNINPVVFSSTYAIPTDIADKYLKIATHTQLKVLLFFMRNISEGIDSDKIAKALSVSLPEVEDALLFWQQRNILIGEAPKEPEQKKVSLNATLPTRADVIRRGLEDEKLMFLLREAQLKFGRNLKQNESQLLVSLYDDYGMDSAVILLLLGYAVREGKCNLSFVKKTATTWLNHGVETVADAERIMADQAKQDLAWSIVQKIFGIDKRSPSENELKLSNLWINEWKMSVELIKAAYDICVDAKSKLSIAYIAKIIENWHKEGITSIDQIEKKQAETKKTKTGRGTQGTTTDFAGYDLDKFEQMLKDKMKRKD